MTRAPGKSSFPVQLSPVPGMTPTAARSRLPHPVKVQAAGTVPTSPGTAFLAGRKGSQHRAVEAPRLLWPDRKHVPEVAGCPVPARARSLASGARLGPEPIAPVSHVSHTASCSLSPSQKPWMSVRCSPCRTRQTVLLGPALRGQCANRCFALVLFRQGHDSWRDRWRSCSLPDPAGSRRLAHSRTFPLPSAALLLPSSPCVCLPWRDTHHPSQPELFGRAGSLPPGPSSALRGSQCSGALLLHRWVRVGRVRSVSRVFSGAGAAGVLANKAVLCTAPGHSGAPLSAEQPMHLGKGLPDGKAIGAGSLKYAESSLAVAKEVGGGPSVITDCLPLSGQSHKPQRCNSLSELRGHFGSVTISARRAAAAAARRRWRWLHRVPGAI